MSGYYFYEMVMGNRYKYTTESKLRKAAGTLIPSTVLAPINDYDTWSTTLRPEVHLQ